ncbi:MAG: hypothetical protein U0470_01235 [Anaerolineae bacterium]
MGSLRSVLAFMASGIATTWLICGSCSMSARLALWYACSARRSAGSGRSGRHRYGFIQRMFLFQSFQLYGIRRPPAS